MRADVMGRKSVTDLRAGVAAVEYRLDVLGHMLCAMAAECETEVLAEVLRALAGNLDACRAELRRLRRDLQDDG